jgi:lysophospholipase L1-like esterase
MSARADASTLRSAAFCLLLALPVAIALTEIRQDARNTLAENGRWVSAKPLMQIPLMGARQFLATRNALAGNRLDLRAWHGYNEVYFYAPLRLGSLALDLRLADDAHLSVLLARTEAGFEGLRLSRHPRFHSMVFHGERSGRFTDRESIGSPPLTSGWHRLAVEAGDRGWVARLDGEAIVRRETGPLALGLVGFRSGFSRVEIDDVEITDRDGRQRVRDGFRNRRGYGGRLATSLLAVWALLWGTALIAARRGAGRGGASDPRLPGHWVVLAALVALVSCLLFLGFDRWVWSRSYIYQERNPNAPAPPALLVGLESLRQRLLGELSIEAIDLPAGEVARRVTRWDLAEPFAWPGPNRFNRWPAYNSTAPGQPRYLPPERLAGLGPESAASRLVFVGGSQLVGVGAEVVEDALVGRVHEALCGALRDVPGATPLAAFNLAVAGGRAPQLLGYYERVGLALAPDLTVVNVSFNDRDPDRLESALRRFVELDRARGGVTLLVVEPMSADKDDPGARLRQAVVREVARDEGVPVLDLEAWMAGPEVHDSGFLWWDQIHLTSLGQEVAGGWLAERIEPELRSLLARASRESP